MKNYYHILGVTPQATADEIKRAYRKLASQHHPDKGGDTAQFQEIQEAYSILSDESKRQQYDNPKPQFNAGFGGSPQFDFDTIFNIFGADLRNQRRQSPRLTLWISLADVITGGPRTISLQTGNTTTDVVINIPVGIHDNDNIRYPGLAPGGNDLIINYRIKPDSNWQCNGTNIITEVMIDIWDLVLGTELTIVDILGKELRVQVPTETQPGSILRARGRGLPARSLTGDWPNTSPGDLMIKLNARIKGPVDSNIIEAIRKSREK